MNSKLIAIIAVVAMCGAALVGVGYAYTASFQDNAGNASVSVEYITPESDGYNTGIGTDPVVFSFNTVKNGSNPVSYTFNAVGGWTLGHDDIQSPALSADVYVTKTLGTVIFTSTDADVTLNLNNVDATTTTVPASAGYVILTKNDEQSTGNNILAVDVTVKVKIGTYSGVYSDNAIVPEALDVTVDLHDLKITYNTIA